MKVDIEENISMFKKVIEEKELAIQSQKEYLQNLKNEEPQIKMKIEQKKLEKNQIE